MIKSTICVGLFELPYNLYCGVVSLSFFLKKTKQKNRHFAGLLQCFGMLLRNVHAYTLVHIMQNDKNV